MYDGDQTTMKIIWSLEANAECERVISRKSFILDNTGGLIRKVGNEASQTFYSMTKDPNKKNSRQISAAEKSMLLSIEKGDLTFDKMIELFAVKYLPKENRTVEPRFSVQDYFTLNTGEYPEISESITTTVGRFILNKLLYSDTPLEKVLGYVNGVLEKDKFGSTEKKIANALFYDKITVDDVITYINVRDWLGFQIHGLVCASFTPGVVKTHPEVKKLRDELYKRYEKELKANDTKVAAEIEKQLIDKTMDVLKDDPGMDLYISGARGSVGNNMKNMYMMRGSIMNPNTEEYDVVASSLNDGLRKQDIPASSNAIVSGAYPKSCGTQVSGYMAKQLLSSCQTEILDDEGTDCGTKRGIPMIVKEKHKYRYIIEGSKLVLLDDTTLPKYLGKKVMMRSPLSCILTKNKRICSKCAGDFHYRIDNKNIGLSASKVGTSLTNLGMKKFHNNVLKYRQIDPDDMLL